MYTHIPLKKLIDKILSDPDLNKEIFEMVKRNYWVHSEGTDHYVQDPKPKTAIKYEKLHTPFAIHDSQFKLLNEYYKMTKYGISPFERLLFAIIKFFGSILWIIILCILILTLPIIGLKVYFVHKVEIYYLILGFIAFYLAYWKIYFSGKEKNLNNKLLVIQLGIDTACMCWINNLLYNINTHSNLNQLKDIFLKDFDYFLYLTQLSYTPFGSIYNIQLKYICTELNINHAELIIEYMTNLEYRDFSGHPT